MKPNNLVLLTTWIECELSWVVLLDYFMARPNVIDKANIANSLYTTSMLSLYDSFSAL